jgi:hypothetical protein
MSPSLHCSEKSFHHLKKPRYLFFIFIFCNHTISEKPFQKNCATTPPPVGPSRNPRKETAMSFQNPVFIPGPTNMPETLRRACDMPTMDHRSSAFADILQPAREGVRKILRSESAEVFIFPATGTGGWEVAITNTLSPGDTVLAARNGMFSHRWIDMCQRHGLTVEIVETPWGEGIPPPGSRRSCAPTRTAASRRFSPPTTKRRPACSRTSPP